jgi:anaerobic selenocysteine-containing dehydrogenase
LRKAAEVIRRATRAAEALSRDYYEIQFICTYCSTKNLKVNSEGGRVLGFCGTIRAFDLPVGVETAAMSRYNIRKYSHSPSRLAQFL